MKKIALELCVVAVNTIYARALSLRSPTVSLRTKRAARHIGREARERMKLGRSHRA